MRRVVGVTVGTAALLVTSACVGGGTPEGGGFRVIDYRLWEKSQKTAYMRCADAFADDNPGLRVEITQRDIADYWPTLLRALDSGGGPDVFTNHVSRYPDLVRREAILPLDELVPEVEAAPYLQGLADLWVAEDGKRYGMLKDWSTTAVFYNKEMLGRAGVSVDEMSGLTWNPGDGGTFEQIIAKLTVDANGVRGHEKGFDKDDVVTYGLGLDTEDAIGLVEWGFLAHTLGWSPTDRSPWGTHYTFDDPRFRSVMAWGRGLVEKGYLAPPDPGGSDAVEDFPTGRYAMVASTARMLSTYTAYDGIQLGIAATPTGPNGERGSMISSRADSIAAGTRNREDAAKWVAFLGSARCQDIVGQAGVVLPAVPSALRKAEDAFAAEGIDVSPFTAHLKAETTFLVPVTEKAEQVAAIIEPALTAVITGEAPPGSLTAANATVNALFE